MNQRGDQQLIGAIEAGGTKFTCGVGTSPRDLSRTQFPTTEHPDAVLGQVAAWLGEQQRARGKLAAIGIGSFGPVDLEPSSPRYGHITSTPKPGWGDTDIVGALRAAFPGIPVGFDTDVNGAALGEHRWGAAQGLADFVYLTVGTGIGAGGMLGGRLIHGLMHPEVGHIGVPRVPGDDFPGHCPFHHDCWEGLCAGPALTRRAGRSLAEVPAEDGLWRLAAEYVARGVTNLVYALSPARVVIGGGVAKAGQLGAPRFFGMVREQVKRLINGYLVLPELEQGIDQFIVPPALGDDAGIAGAIALGQHALASR